ncbi:MAG: type III pantothenate kinase, partial [Candidatus Omnitrophica bacterium]|nr:type III pantothenate kinase [Candidatus Omnitrophota bacterium]
ISSVVPKARDILSRDLKKLLGITPFILGKNITAPIKNLYHYPKKAGQDRLVNAYAGAMLYGAPLIVVDLGTAVTFDVVSRKKEYLGGMILPGLRVSLEGLFENTALVPKIKLKSPKEFIGRDTESGVLSGLVFGYAALIDKLSERIKEKIGKGAFVIGTGGDMELVGRYCREMDRIDPDLALKGLDLIMRSRKDLCCKSAR